MSADPIRDQPQELNAQRVVVFHDFYGCDTGCCGHVAVLYEGTVEVRRGHFDFGHPYGGSWVDFAHRVAANAFPGVSLDFTACEISDD